ncbi:TPA: hypothetical protein N0F65_002050 [Lagenidium giganteum]|uniref:Anaphase-promoting complex subunit 2 n=1 Tax=Lagenidium giganteum TaxID=4803 RepID=A0AAV2ZA36_9STRA|nr:TPA: hypothetical protein N0F65_002050 [Lagenidium giganteum]
MPKAINRALLYAKLFAFDVRPDASSQLRVDEDYQQLLFRLLSTREDSYDALREMLLQRLTYWLRAEVVPTFWEFFQDYDAMAQPCASHNGQSKTRQQQKKKRYALMMYCGNQLLQATAFAEEAFAHCVEIASIFDSFARGPAMPSMVDELKDRFRCVTFEDSAHKQQFHGVLTIFFSTTFLKFQGKGQDFDFDSRSIRELLFQLEWTPLVEPALLRVLHNQVQKMILTSCGTEFDRHQMDEIEEWACLELLPWLDELMQTVKESSTEKWKAILSQHVLQEFGKRRISQLFEIIKEYPDSIPALEDLKSCLERTKQQQLLVTQFRSDLTSRLLQPGANTSQVLDIYVSTIKAFRLLDPKGVMLEAFSEPIKQYLRNRRDTVRCIVSSLTDDQNGDLFEELRRNNMRLIQHDDDSDDDEDMNPADWEPDPIEADPTKSSRSRSSDDILRILVNIYGSKELFVNEYRMMLADKLLRNLEYDTDRDVRTLELLKLRFGEDSLQQCEIMVRDVEDSKRINANISSARAQQPYSKYSIVDATIVSSEFWPPFQQEEFAVHSIVEKKIEEFKKAYQVLRNPRSLNWNPSLGSVQLSIELSGETRSFTVSTIQATIILHFGDQDTWNLEDLATTMGLTEDALHRHISFWVNQGVLLHSHDRKSLIGAKTFNEARHYRDTAMNEFETAVSSDAQAEENLRTLETYIIGMLSNFGCLSTQRIHNMLSVFARSGAQPYDKTISGLAVILGQLVAKGKLEQVAGQYQLAK